MNALLSGQYLIRRTLAFVASSAVILSAVVIGEQTAVQKTSDNDVLALWLFGGKTPAVDERGCYPFTLRGSATFGKDGTRNWVETFFDTVKPSGVQAGSSTKLSPEGPFSIDLWVNGKEDLAGKKAVFLIDKMHIDYDLNKAGSQQMRDYQIKLIDAGKGLVAIQGALGFGDMVARVKSSALVFQPGGWHQIAMTYDGAGECILYYDGEPVGRSTIAGRHGVLAGSYPVVIGDRVGSSYGGFPGYISHVRISKVVRSYIPIDPARHVIITCPERTSFIRMEKDNKVTLQVRNNTDQVRPSVSLAVVLFDEKGTAVSSKNITMGNLKGRDVITTAYEFDISMRAGTYRLDVKLSSSQSDSKGVAASFVLFLAAQKPNAMTVINWGMPNWTNEYEMNVFRDCFTHAMGINPDTRGMWDAMRDGKDMTAATIKDSHVNLLNRALREDFRLCAVLHPARMRYVPENTTSNFIRIDREGKPFKEKQVCCLFPEIQEFCRKTGEAVGRAYGRYPAFDLALIHSEVVDHSNPCFHDHDRKAYSIWAHGQEIPDGVMGSWGADYRQRLDFPKWGVVQKDYPLREYYLWYWKEGHGWNQAHTSVHLGLHAAGRDDIRTWFDPAVRAPALWGSGGGVDAILEWSYTHPDPLRVAVQADELLAMADGSEVAGSFPKRKQQVFKMTQIIWYRSKSAPKANLQSSASTQAPSWVARHPDANFITMPPDHLRESLWLMLSRPISGLGYHGWESLVESKGTTFKYQCTDLRTAPELARLMKTVVRPLGPMLLEIPDRQADIAYLESFTSQVLAGKGSGWGDKYRYYVLQYAQLQPQVVYEETLARDGLGAFKVLFAFDCDVLPESVVTIIKGFQARGGILVSDESLCPALNADIVLPQIERKPKADEDRRSLIEGSVLLRKQLDAFYKRHVDSSSPDIITRVRSFLGADYVFAVNDARKYGDYVGMYGKVMEDGVDADATLTIARKNGVVYDLMKCKQLPVRADGNSLSIHRDFGPCEGTVFLVTERAIETVAIIIPPLAKIGKTVALGIEVRDTSGHPVDAVVPLHMVVRTQDGNATDWCGYHAAVKGTLAVPLSIPGNEPKGVWRIEVTELASGKKADAALRIE